jgi:hypothetical protein
MRWMRWKMKPDMRNTYGGSCSMKAEGRTPVRTGVP